MSQRSSIVALLGIAVTLSGCGDDGASNDASGGAPRTICGDGVVSSGEACDDGNTQPGDGCSPSCEPEASPACGNGTVEADEACDDGNAIDTDSCRTNCVPAACGDGIVQAGVEECDDANTDATDACLSSCVAASCGDGIVQAGVEECDDANTDATDACLSSCVAASCGDSFVQAGVEECDDANTDATDACPSSCIAASCGDGFVQAGVEECDDANTDATDACLTNCAAASCGDGFVQAGVEGCDDANTDDTDTCPSICQPAKCGDGFVEAGVEGCDDANTDDTDACLTDCVAASCGDGFVQAGVEACDDGNTDNTDDCPITCAPASCGDGFVRSGVEACDDGNTEAADGCGPNCKLEALRYYQDFDSGSHDLQLTSNSATVVWHVSTVKSVSAPNSLRLADPVTGNYNAGLIKASAETPYFPVPEVGALIGFQLLKHTEVSTAYDAVYVEVLDKLDSLFFTQKITGQSLAWKSYIYQIPAALAGKYVRVRFRFDTVDNQGNNYPGVFLDDIWIDAPKCGDGIVTSSAGEDCDDGNVDDNDGCPSTCVFPCFSGAASYVIHDPSTGRCYGAFSSKLTGTAAENKCVSLGGHLASITNAAENSLVLAIIKVFEVHIGATDAALEGTWMWTDGEPFSYSNWRMGEPNNYNNNENCVLMLSDGLWNDADCASPREFICETVIP